MKQKRKTKEIFPNKSKFSKTKIYFTFHNKLDIMEYKLA